MATAHTLLMMDGNEAAARIAYQTNEVIAIYPITPASAMGEWSDAWAAQQQPNLWGHVPKVIEMQSEAGAAGAIHGALQAGSLSTTFTASQGLLLMLPNMYKIAGELSPTVFHIAARSLAVQALSIFGDHSDVMAARGTGFAMLCAGSVQEVQDFALLSQACALRSRIPFLHFFDGFRTSHEIAKIATLDPQTIADFIDQTQVDAFRARALSPERPQIRGTSQNPDVYFQSRETVNPFYQALPEQLQQLFQQFAQQTGRPYQLFQYQGAADAQRIIIIMGSGAETVHETVDYLNHQGEKVGLIKVRLFRPFSVSHLLAAIPQSCQHIAVLDRTKEAGCAAEPLYQDVVNALFQRQQQQGIPCPRVIGGRYGLSCKEFTPAMVQAIFQHLSIDKPKHPFTIGIHDDVSHSSLCWDEAFCTDAQQHNYQALFYGLGSDGTVSANKNSIKIIGEHTDYYAQGYFVYDSKKSGAITISHLRFGHQPIRSSYLIQKNSAQFIACHQTRFLQQYPMLDYAADNAIFLVNSHVTPAQFWDSLPATLQQQILQKQLRVYTIDAYAVAQQCGMGRRINTIMQACFFAISGILPIEQAIQLIKDAAKHSYGNRGKAVLDANYQAIDQAIAALSTIDYPNQFKQTIDIINNIPDSAPSFVQQVTSMLLAGKGDQIPVSQLPVDGSFPSGTAAYEKRNLALKVPVWEADLCTQCGKCVFVCPHSVVRSKVFGNQYLAQAPQGFLSAPVKGKDYPADHQMTYQISVEDCTGCTLCVDICPITDKSNASRKAINMQPYSRELQQQGQQHWAYFLQLPDTPKAEIKQTTLKGAMLLPPLFEFSGACTGCGETPYIRLASQLFGDRMLVANATGCSSIYGGNLPTTPWTFNQQGRGPAWSNSLFEDNAEFGLGMRIAIDQQRQQALNLLQRLPIDSTLSEQLCNNAQHNEAEIEQQRQWVIQLNQQLQQLDQPMAQQLLTLSENFIKKSVWIIGGDGWAYDIGYGGLDHVLASGQDVNILVLDTEVYSNTGGQTSKATPKGAVAKFSAAGKGTGKKDLALLAMSYENVYVAHVAYGAKDIQTLRAFIDAEAHPGVSLIIAYAPCIAHGVDMQYNHRQQQLAVNSGHWPLLRYNPALAAQGKNPLQLDSKAPNVAYRDFIKTETRFNMLWRSHPEQAEQLLQQAQQDVQHRYHHYQQLAGLSVDDADTPISTQEKKHD